MKKIIVSLCACLVVLLTSIAVFADDSIFSILATVNNGSNNRATGSHTLTWDDWVLGGAPSNWNVTVTMTATATINGNRGIYAVRVIKNGSQIDYLNFYVPTTIDKSYPAAIGDTFTLEAFYDVCVCICEPPKNCTQSTGTCRATLYP